MANQDVVIPGNMLIVQRRSAPFNDTVTVSDQRVHNTPAPLPIQPSPAYAPGDPAGRVWSNKFMESLNHLRTGLYAPIPLPVLNPDGTVSIKQHRYQFGDEIELAYTRLLTADEWPGPRNDNSYSPYTTFRDTPRAVFSDPTLWTGLGLSGFLFHQAPDGAVQGIAGPWVPDDQMFLKDGAAKVWHGDFTDHDGVERRWGMTNDFDFHPTLPGVLYVCDILNGRIATAVHLGGPDMEIKTFASGLTRPTSCQVDRLDGSLWVTESSANRITRIVPNGLVEGSRSVVLTGLNDPFCIRQFSNGNFGVMENAGLQRLLEVSRG